MKCQLQKLEHLLRNTWLVRSFVIHELLSHFEQRLQLNDLIELRSGAGGTLSTSERQGARAIFRGMQ